MNADSTTNVNAAFVAHRGELQLDIDLQVAHGETLALVGPNGAGKSSTLRVLAGLDPIHDGQVVLDGKTVDAGPAQPFVPPESRNVGVVFQNPMLFPHLSAIDNVAYGLRSRGIKTKLARKVAATWLERIGLPEHGDSRPDQLSGGQAQRVALARALATKPKLLLLDEPLAAADATARLELHRILQAQLRNFEGSCVLVAHDIRDAIALADRVGVIEAGRVVQAGTLDQLGNKPASQYVADLIGFNCFRGTCSASVLTVANGATIVVGSQHEGEAIATLHPRAIALFREQPAGSPRNVFRAPVANIEPALHCVRVQIGGALPMVAEVTQSAARDLELAQGGEIWVAIKATEFRLAPV